MNSGFVTVSIVAFVFSFIILPASIKIIKEYQRGVVFRLGRLSNLRGPGIRFIWPIIDKMILVDTRAVEMAIAEQDIMMTDRAVVAADATVIFCIIDPDKAILAVENYAKATILLAQRVVRDAVEHSTLDTVMRERNALNAKMLQAMNERTEQWGVRVGAIELRRVDVKHPGIAPTQNSGSRWSDGLASTFEPQQQESHQEHMHTDRGIE